jgi:hypothetical protein
MPAPRVTLDLIRRYIMEGRGLGHGDAYKPMIQLKRWNASPVSTQTFGRLPGIRRPTHFLCRSEWLLALLFIWIGCRVREQFPMWPWESHHPIAGLDVDLDSRLKRPSGTLALCREAGIDHGTFVGTDIPYIWTLDHCLEPTWLPLEHRGPVIVSIKPLSSETYCGDIDPIARGPEKLEIERRFCEELSLRYFVADRGLFPGPLLGQLELFSSSADLPIDSPVARARDGLLARHAEALIDEPPEQWRNRLVADWGLCPPDADLAVHNIFWHQLLDVDLTREIQMEDVLRPGGRGLRQAVRTALAGAVK